MLIVASKTFPPFGSVAILSIAAMIPFGLSWMIESVESNTAPAAIPAGMAAIPPLVTAATAPVPITTVVLVADLSARFPPL
ncbi:hypothetical protein DERP_013268 [Dermatophagoides pteronyssinus]|uniref:Uncharacterized protein n=1 Tax=Dermatophagoides pteronyssinus TaxID=6956 RepID=A0ABQ8J3N3_DERPT|nr:hypothetical protein DERP_013268 [Dermatophagoides pteronyssinus]